MSQLNNKTNTAKKTFLLLLVFTILCAGITVAFIYNTLSIRKEIYSNNENSVELENKINYENEVKDDKVAEIDKLKLTDKYFTNGISIDETNISLGDIVFEYENNIQRKLEINYVQISGLKDTNVEKIINDEIENTVFSLRNDEELQKSDIDSIHIDAYVFANFSDVLSVLVTKNTNILKENGEIDYKNEYIGLNYSLETGEKIKFNDLFTNDASIKNIITQSVYDNMVLEYAVFSEDLEANMDKIDYGDIENKIFKILHKYNQNQDLDFYFSQSHIVFIINNVTYSIEMANFYESIAIYSRYKTEKSIYKNESLVKDVNYVFSSIDMTDYIVDAHNKTDNFYYEIITHPLQNYNEEIQKSEDIVKEKIYKKINEYAILANRNKEKGYILSIIYFINEYDGKIGYNYYGYLCSMDRKFYDEKLEETIASAYREEVPEIWIKDYSWIDSQNIMFEEEILLNVEDFNNPIEIENVTTKEDRESIEMENQN